jgi:hypothetical protein
MAAGMLLAASLVPLASGGGPVARAAPSASRHFNINCEYSPLCPDLANPAEAYGQGEYVGHDEPSLLFYSNRRGSGNRLRSTLTLPRDPSGEHPKAPGKSYNFELHPTFWYGMALCDTQSYPEQIRTCKPDSDSNIVDPAVSPNHPGTAFMELQFYPPGWVPWPVWAVAPGATTCTPTKWCAAMNVFSLLEDPVNGTTQNPTCAARVGLETFEFAFVTKNGVAQAPANPIDSTLTTFTPNPRRDLLMNSGDRIQVTIHDTEHGVQARLRDLTTEQSGSMTASPANGFAQIKYAPTGTSCKAIPYAFHPMYSTSSEQTRVIWAAHSYNVAFSDEIGHFQFCNGKAVPATPFGLDQHGNPVVCPAGNTEESGANQEPTEGAGEDDFCFPASESLRFRVQGCTETNTGFDGVSYTPVWPDGNTKLHPTPIRFTSARTGEDFNKPYSRVAFEADLPRIEFSTCDRTTGSGCTRIPITDDNQPASFYPFFTNARLHDKCNWQFGNSIPGDIRDFGRNAEYGPLLPLDYLAFGGGGATVTLFNDFRGVIGNPC